MWTALLKSGSQQIDKSHLDTALAGYATENFVHTNLNALKGTGLPTTEGYRNVTEIANTLLTFLTGSDTDSTINKWMKWSEMKSYDEGGSGYLFLMLLAAMLALACFNIWRKVRRKTRNMY